MRSEKSRQFIPLEQTAFQKLEQATFLKGFLKPFKGKGEIEHWAEQCEQLRVQLIALAQNDVLRQGQSYPFALLPVRLAMQTTGAGTAFLRWRNPDRTVMGVALWEQQMLDPYTPSHLIEDLYQMEIQRIALNMQISLVHSIAKQARECASKADNARAVFDKRRNT